MKDVTEFIESCKTLLNKHGVYLTKKTKLILEQIYKQQKYFTPESIASHIMHSTKKEIPLKDIKTLFLVLEEEQLIIANSKNKYSFSHIQTNEKSQENELPSTTHRNNIETSIVKAIKKYGNDYTAIIDFVQSSFTGIDSSIIIKHIDAYNLLLNSPKLDIMLKNMLQDISFIEQNPSVIISLAKLFFQADNIVLENDKIIIKKEVQLPQSTVEENTPDIDEIALIRRVLQKIKYDRIKEQDIHKVNDLAKHQKYKSLSNTLMRAIDYQAAVKTLNDEEMKMNTQELKSFLDTA